MNLQIPRPAMAATIAILASVIATCSRGDDWPSWRGTGQRGYSLEKNLPGKWSPKGENLVWSQPIGARSAPVEWDGRVYVLHLTGEGQSMQEEVVCLDSEDGKVLWRGHPGTLSDEMIEQYDVLVRSDGMVTMQAAGQFDQIRILPPPAGQFVLKFLFIFINRNFWEYSDSISSIVTCKSG